MCLCIYTVYTIQINPYMRFVLWMWMFLWVYHFTYRIRLINQMISKETRMCDINSEYLNFSNFGYRIDLIRLTEKKHKDSPYKCIYFFMLGSSCVAFLFVVFLLLLIRKNSEHWNQCCLIFSGFFPSFSLSAMFLLFMQWPK